MPESHSFPADRVAPFEQAIIALRADGTIRAWNDGATALYGLTEGEVLDRPLAEVVPTTWPVSEDAVAESVAGAGGWSGVTVRRDRDGGALLALTIRVRTPEEPGGVVETTLRVPDEVASVALAPGEQELSDRLFVLAPVRDASGEITDMDVVYANAEAAAALGRVPSELVGRRASELLPGYADSPMFATHRRVIATGERATVADRRIELPPGSGIEHVYAGTVVPFGSGIASRSRDVTAERRALQALDDAQARVRMALAVAPVSVGQLNERLEYEWLLDNISGADPAEMIGRELGARAAPGDGERLRAAARRVLETGEAEQLEIRGGPGHERLATLEAAITRREDLDGGRRGVRIAVVDISSHRRLEADLRAGRDMLRAVLEHFPGAVAVKDLEGRILFLNSRGAALLGTTPEEAAGRLLADLAGPADAARFAEHDAEVLRTGEDREAREPLGDAVLLVRRFAIRDADGQVRALGSIALDPEAGLTVPPAP